MSNLTAQQIEGAIVTQVILDALAANYWHIADNVARRQGGGR